jgi:cell division protein FtsL
MTNRVLILAILLSFLGIAVHFQIETLQAQVDRQRANAYEYERQVMYLRHFDRIKENDLIDDRLMLNAYSRAISVALTRKR